MKVPCSVSVLTLVLAGNASATPCVNFKIEPVESLTVQQIGQFASTLVQSAGQYTVVLRMFDPEDRPSRGDMQAAGFLLVGRGDIGEVPVGALIWSSGPIVLQLETVPTGDFRIMGGRFDDVCTPVGLKVGVHADGMVFVDQQEIGKVR